MEFVNQVLTLLGLTVDESAPGIIRFCLYFLILSCLVLLNVINISFYLLSIYILSNEKVLKKIPVEYTRIHKLIRSYKNIRVGYIIFEGILLYFCLFLMISITYGLVSFYIHFK